MNINKKVLGLALSLLVATNIGTASATTSSAQNGAEEVLFKIHDIKPVKNHEGEVIACDFSTTIYNRSHSDVKEALLDFEWKDNAIEEVIENEKKQNDEVAEFRSFGRAFSTTERKTSKNVTTMIEVPAIKSYRQVTVNSRVNTDRCFLLIEKVNYKVKSCRMGSDSKNNNARGNGANCNRMFKFVSPEDAQYYLSFKEISVAEQENQENEKNDKAASEVDGIYEDTVSALNKAESIIKSIK